MASVRRGRGEGSIRRRKRGFEARFVGSDGKRHSLYALTRADANAKLTAALRDLTLGVFVAGERQSVAHYLGQWLVDAARSRRPRTMQRYRQLVASHAVPVIGALELRKLTPQHLAALYADLSVRQAPSSIAQLHAVLHGALDQAVQWNLIARNPADAVRGPKVERPTIHLLSADQVRILLAAVAGDPLEALYLVAVTTGMRSGEILGLTWADVDLDAARLQVRRTLYRLRGQWLFGEPKTSAGRRAIALTEAATAALRAHRLRQAEQLLAVAVRIGPEALVFADRWGNPLNGFHLTERHFKPLLRRAMLPVIRFHDLRHTAATLMLSSGVNPKVVAEMLGHASVSTTLNVYAHVLPTMQEDAARRLDAALKGAG